MSVPRYDRLDRHDDMVGAATLALPGPGSRGVSLRRTGMGTRSMHAAHLYHSTPVETQNSFCSGSDILTHRVPPKLCTPWSMR